MRKIEPYFDNPPSTLWVETSKRRNHTPKNPSGESKIQQALSQQLDHDFDNKVYGATVVKNRLKVIFKSKCAFCETNTHAGAHKDVEHYRFKKHYYWLGYEWTNLLLSCQICNRDFKGADFPLENESNRVVSHPLNITGELDLNLCHILCAPLVAENPLLLHPAIDNPKEHLRFLPNGLVEGISVKGGKSIEVYGLRREELFKKRKRIVKLIQEDIWEEYKHNPLPNEERIALEVRKVITKLIRCVENKESEYIGFVTAILENFETFVIDNTTNGIDLPNKNIMRQAVREMLNA